MFKAVAPLVVVKPKQTKGKGTNNRTVTGAEAPSRRGLIFGRLVE